MAETKHASNTKTAKTNRKNRLAQAFKQAPWRSRVQVVGGFLVALIVVLIVAGIYLSISGQAATAGLEAYRLDLKRVDLERQIADTRAQIAVLTSASNMEARALEMGFQRISPEEAIYLKIPGYAGKQTMMVTTPPGAEPAEKQLVKYIYRESLWDWLFTGINALSEGGLEVKR